MKGVLSWLVCWTFRAGTRDFCSALAALIGPVQNVFFLTVHYFNSLVPIAQHDAQAAVLGRLSLRIMCLWSQLQRFIFGCCAEPFQIADFEVFLVVALAGCLV
jgi:hypothetical protein